MYTHILYQQTGRNSPGKLSSTASLGKLIGAKVTC